MKPARFDYYSPRELPEILSLLERYGEDARPLAGGQSLVPLMNMRILQPAALIDLKRCDALAGSVETSEAVEIRAMMRQSDGLVSRSVATHVPLLAAALHYVGGAVSRNRGTICGSLAHADPMAELPCVSVALDAEFVIRHVAGQRVVPASEFFISALSTSVQPGELLAAVKFPNAKAPVKSAFVEVGIRKHGFALVGIALQLELDDEGACRDARLSAMGASEIPVRLRGAEKAAIGARLDANAVGRIADAAYSEVSPHSDPHADAIYRRHLVRVLTRRAFEQALDPVGRRRKLV